jgi:hypothetical protein
MKIRQLASVLAFSALGLGACGGDDDGGGGSTAQKGTVNQTTAKSMATSTVSAVNAAKSNSGMSIANSIQSAASAAQGIITPAGGQPQSADVLGHVAEALTAGDCTCDDTAKKCVFDKCGSTGVEISGELSWDAGSLKCTNLTYVISNTARAQGSSVTIKTNCDLTFTANELNGTLNSDVNSSSEGGGYTTTFVSTSGVTFNKLTYDASGPTGGSMSVKGSLEVTTNGNSQKYAGSATITFP